MSFKDKKEEVIEIRLTSYGKHLLSKGELSPEFYAFYDDDIIYDSKYTGFEENQNDAEDRILSDSPVTRLQTNFTGLETQIEAQIEQRRSGEVDSKESIQASRERNYSLSAPLGKSSISSDLNPSWDITIHGQQIKQSLQHKESQDHQTLKIPQIDLGNLEFQTYVADDVHGVIAQGHPTGHEEESEFYQVEYPNGHVVFIEHAELVIEIDEMHTDAEYHNYDIEVFMIDDETEEETLIPLSFMNGVYGDNENVVNDILIEQEHQELPDTDETYVEHYLSINVDANISGSKLCRLGYRTDFSKRGYIRVDCDERTGRDRMSEIYDVDPTTEPFGDDC